ncbi:hypothetical protein SAMN02799624_05969 [Paenibacillus sp. UNC496MF]|uniref:hypothetical protein n=1 Tax=Paenibacillus sp. UNC496MF TaxID=1502753 RepID=UPI0008F33C3A|nr:hypothetical protein [Paenibacillus sp. UNC496MF]SFJ79165.1 hypothetical protein SAMN02799624_05969 [Paenibacillus sp. UNC496MF]
MKTRAIAAAVLCVAILAGYRYAQPRIGAWQGGMARIVNDTDSFTDTGGYPVPGSYSVDIDLADLGGNIGKVLYDDGSYLIDVGWVDNSGSAMTGGYRIGLRSHGTYSPDGADLVSGSRHRTMGGHAFSSDMTASMTAAYNGQNYESSVFAIGGLNEKDGDEFAFYVFPADAYEAGGVSLQETGTVTLTVTGLYRNVWRKKETADAAERAGEGKNAPVPENGGAADAGQGPAVPPSAGTGSL